EIEGWDSNEGRSQHYQHRRDDRARKSARQSHGRPAHHEHEIARPCCADRGRDDPTRLRICPRLARGEGVESARSAGETIKFPIRISATEVARAKIGMFNRKEQSYALDNIRYSAGTVAAWTGHLVHPRRVHSHPARDRDRCADYPADLRTPGIITSKRRNLPPLSASIFSFFV